MMRQRGVLFFMVIMSEKKEDLYRTQGKTKTLPLQIKCTWTQFGFSNVLELYKIYLD